jgi:hypothetical protein
MMKRGVLLASRRLATRGFISVALIAGAGSGVAAMLPALSASAAGATPSVSVSSSLNPSTYGDQVSFTATVTPASPTPTGTVTFTYTNSNNAATVFQPICTESGSDVVTLNGSGLASCTPQTALLAGTDTVTASYSGDGTYAAGTNSPLFAQNVSPRATQTTIANNGPTATTYGTTASFKATITVAPGDSNTQAVTVPAPGNTAIFFANAIAPANQLPDCAGANSPNVTGTGTPPVIPSTATCNTKDLPGGSDHVFAFYNGDGNYAQSQTSSGAAQTVNPANTNTTVAPLTSSSTYAHQVTITATVTPPNPGVAGPTGKVAFAAGGTNLPDCSGANAPAVVGTGTPPVAPFTATCKTNDLPGSHGETVTATYSGDSNYSGSVGSSTANGYVVNPVSTSTSAPVPSSNPVGVSQQVTYTATVTPSTAGVNNPTGTVTFLDNGSAISAACSAAPVSTGAGGTTASCSTSYGSTGVHSITATYNGDANYAASSPSSALSENVNTDSTTTTIQDHGPNPSNYGQSVSFTATVTPNPSAGTAPTGTVTFSDGGTPICSNVQVSASGGNATASCVTSSLAAGVHSITASYSGDSTYGGSATTSAASQTVEQNPGYWMVGSDGGIFSFGPRATFYGSMGSQHLNAPIVGIARDPATGGYWMVASDGGVFSFNAPFFGSMGSTHLNKPIVGIAAAPGGNGYWLVASDGGIFTFGPGAAFYGSTGAMHLNRPVVGMAAAPSGNGYWLVASDGGIFTFGPGATFYGSTGAIALNKPIVGLAAAPGGSGYWLVGSDGGIFTFGPGATFYGSTGAIHLNQPVVGIAAAPSGNGYSLVASDGGMFTFGPGVTFYGSMGATRLNGPIVGMASAG